MQAYRQRPITVEARQWDGESYEEWEAQEPFYRAAANSKLWLFGPLGDVREINAGDWIVRSGDSWFIFSPEEFASHYEVVE